MSTTLSMDAISSTSINELEIPIPYNPSVIWPSEFTTSLEKNETIRNAFKKTYMRIQKAGCQFLLLEPTNTPQGYFFSLYHFTYD